MSDVLTTIMESEPQTFSDLYKVISIPETTLANTVQMLIDNGFAHKIENGFDVTDSGKDMLENIKTEKSKVLEDLVLFHIRKTEEIVGRSLTSSEKALLREHLLKIIKETITLNLNGVNNVYLNEG